MAMPFDYSGANQRKVFESNQELRDAVKWYCPLPDGDIDDETTKQQYCDRESAEEIACTYGWPINKWDVSQIEDFTGVFYGSKKWNKVTNQYGPIDGIPFFNEDISTWNVSQATRMDDMFFGTRHFNQDLSTWDVSNVTTMYCMFHGAHQFNQDISTWNVSNVTNMDWMFASTNQFNQDLSNWDVSNVITMEAMFRGTEQFNQDLSTWDVSNVTNIDGMFSNAEQFNQTLSSWDVWNVRNTEAMLDDDDERLLGLEIINDLR